MPRQASVPLLRGTFRPVAIWTSRPHAFELHVSHTVSDFAEEDLLLHAVRESDGPADFRPRPAVALWHHMDEILRMMGLRVALVRPEMGAVLETGLRDHPAARQVLVRLEAQLEVRLDRLRLLDEPRQSDRPIRVRVAHFDETGFQQVRRLEEAELQPPADDLPEEAGVVERLRLDLIDHDRPVAEEMHDDIGLPEGRGLVPARMRLADAVVRQIALFAHEAEQERLADRGRFVRAPEEFRQVEDGTLAQGAHPIFARGLLRRAPTGIYLEIDGAAAGLDDVAARSQIPIHEVSDLEGVDRRARGSEQFSRRDRPSVTADFEAASLDEGHRLQEIKPKPASRSRRAEKPAVIDAARLRRVVDDHPVVDEFPGHGARRRPGPR